MPDDNSNKNDSTTPEFHLPTDDIAKLKETIGSAPTQQQQILSKFFSDDKNTEKIDAESIAAEAERKAREVVGDTQALQVLKDYYAQHGYDAEIDHPFLNSLTKEKLHELKEQTHRVVNIEHPEKQEVNVDDIKLGNFIHTNPDVKTSHPQPVSPVVEEE